MKQQRAFTLVELMVVMAIIAVLSTAGISAYGGYIKKSRDTVRLGDLKAIETIILSESSSKGKAPTLSELQSAITSVNGEPIRDPSSNATSCLDGANCDYWYSICDGGAGYVLRANFESESNRARYGEDVLVSIGTSASDLSAPHDSLYYDVGNCNVVDAGGGKIFSLATVPSVPPTVPSPPTCGPSPLPPC